MACVLKSGIMFLFYSRYLELMTSLETFQRLGLRVKRFKKLTKRKKFRLKLKKPKLFPIGLSTVFMEIQKNSTMPKVYKRYSLGIKNCFLLKTSKKRGRFGEMKIFIKKSHSVKKKFKGGFFFFYSFVSLFRM